MDHDSIEPENEDPASKAFARLRREVAVMRLAVEKLADEPGKSEIPTTFSRSSVASPSSRPSDRTARSYG